MKEVYVVNCCRTAVGSFGGSLKDTPATELGAVVVKEALNRAGVKPEQVDELMFGCVLTAALGQNPARQVGVKAGLPYSVPAYTVGMVCGSGMKSVIEGARAILCGDADIIVAGGTENMSAAPYALPAERWGARMGDKKVVDTMIKDGLWDAYNNYHMGTTAENICDVWGITREELDAFGAASQQKTEAAQKAGRFDDEIVPVMVKNEEEMVEFKVDEVPPRRHHCGGPGQAEGRLPRGVREGRGRERGFVPHLLSPIQGFTRNERPQACAAGDCGPGQRHQRRRGRHCSGLQGGRGEVRPQAHGQAGELGPRRRGSQDHGCRPRARQPSGHEQGGP